MKKMFVYFLGAGHHFGQRIKIGCSRDPLKRLAELQTGSSVKLRLLASIEKRSEAEARGFEKWLHRSFAEYRTGGEWFTSSSPLREFIVAIDSGDEDLAAHALEWAERQMRKRAKKRMNQRDSGRRLKMA